MSVVASKSPAYRLFTHPFAQVQIKENFKALRHWPLCGKFHVSISWRHHGSSLASWMPAILVRAWCFRYRKQEYFVSIRQQNLLWAIINTFQNKTVYREVDVQGIDALAGRLIPEHRAGHSRTSWGSVYGSETTDDEYVVNNCSQLLSFDADGAYSLHRASVQLRQIA